MPSQVRIRFLGRLVLAIALLYAVARWVLPIGLEAYARSFIVDEALTPADATVTLSGGNGERLHAAIGLYRRHLARTLFIVGPDVPLLPVYTGGDSLSQGEAKRRIALRRGVPPDSVVLVLGPTSTIEEATASLETAKEHAWSSLIVVTSPFHSRRARATFRHVFRDSGIEVKVYHLPLGRSSDDPRRWWKSESDTMSVLTETIKSVFYAWNYRIFPWS